MTQKDLDLQVRINEVLFFSNFDNIKLWRKQKLTKTFVKTIWQREMNIYNDWSDNWLNNLYIDYEYNSNEKDKLKYQYLYYIDVIELFDNIIKPFLDEKKSEFGEKQLLEKLLLNTNDIIRNLLVTEIWIPVNNVNTTIDDIHTYSNILEFNKVIFPENDNNRISYISNALRNLLGVYVYNSLKYGNNSYELTYDIIRFYEAININLFEAEKSPYKLLEWKGYNERDQYNTWAVQDYVKSIDIIELLYEYTKDKTDWLTDEQIKDIVNDAWQYNSSTISDSIFSKLNYYIENNGKNYFN